MKQAAIDEINRDNEIIFNHKILIIFIAIYFNILLLDSGIIILFLVFFIIFTICNGILEIYIILFKNQSTTHCFLKICTACIQTGIGTGLSVYGYAHLPIIHSTFHDWFHTHPSIPYNRGWSHGFTTAVAQVDFLKSGLGRNFDIEEVLNPNTRVVDGERLLNYSQKHQITLRKNLPSLAHHALCIF